MAVNTNIQTFIDAISKLSNAEQLAFSNLIWKRTIQGNDFSKMHTIKNGVRSGDLIPLADAGNGYDYMKSTKGDASQCTGNECNIDITLSTKTWTPARYNCKTEICYKDLESKFLDFYGSDASSFKEMTQSAFVDFLMTLISKKVQDSLWTKAYFAESNSTNTALNGHNGLFIQLEAIAPAGNSKRVEIAENAQTTYALQSALGAQVGYDTYNAMLKARSRNLKKDKKAVIYSTRALAENYQEWLRASKQVNCCTKDPLTNDYSIDTLMIFGVKIVVVDEWDDIINLFSEFNDGTKWVNPHRAVLISKDNMPVGTIAKDNFDAFDLKVNTYDELFKIVPEYTFDIKVVQDDDVVLAM